jgi:hypothetical protein
MEYLLYFAKPDDKKLAIIKRKFTTVEHELINPWSCEKEKQLFVVINTIDDINQLCLLSDIIIREKDYKYNCPSITIYNGYIE